MLRCGKRPSRGRGGIFAAFVRVGCWGSRKAFTLVEVVISTAITALVLGAIVYGYVTTSRRSEWSAYSLAGHALVMQRVEQTRAAKWDPLAYPPVDELMTTNFPPTVSLLDVPVTGTNQVYGTNVTSISQISSNPPLKMIEVVCFWPFQSRGPFSNRVITYRAPDQ